MAATKVETLTNPRDSLPNTYKNITAREIDFVTRFGNNWEALRQILGLVRPIKKSPGTALKSYKAKVTLESGNVNPGCVIPFSTAEVEQVAYEDLTVQKYAKAVPLEDVEKYGAEIAVQKTDEAFLFELQTKVLDGFYDFVKGDASALTSTETTFQMAVSVAIGKVRAKFQQMRKNATDIIVFANIEDAYRYLGAAEINIQSAFGINYVENFLGAKLILTSEVEAGKVWAIPSDNIVLYYADPGDSEFARLGLNYTVQGETNLIGFHAQGNYSTAVGESYALLGLVLWAEYADAIAIVTIDPNYEG